MRRASWALPPRTPRMSSSVMMRYSLPSIVTSVPLVGEQHAVADLHLERHLAVLRGAVAHGEISPCIGFSLAVSGRMMPPAVLYFLDAPDDDAVVNGPELQALRPPLHLICSVECAVRIAYCNAS